MYVQAVHESEIPVTIPSFYLSMHQAFVTCDNSTYVQVVHEYK